ncbi:substrate-binding periplasmic protein [Enemella evansiae]|uniref:substrate-binding periplasmic protein n=1 Tax=Enemella evansiae TaxID=2016499 RepID=UPI0015C661EB|nr:transporter substrate-binding domain-containing protein [Enemella evansiae]
MVAAVCVVAAGLLVSVFAPEPVRPSKPVIVTSGEWAPYVGEGMSQGGPTAQIVTEVLERHGYDPTVRYTSWSLATKQSQEQGVFGTFPFTAGKDRLRDFVASDPLMEFEYVLFTRRDNERAKQIKVPEDLRGLKIGVVPGYDYWASLMQAPAGKVTFDSSLEAFEALNRGDVDLVPESLESGAAVLTDPRFSGDAAAFESLDPSGNPLLGSKETLHFLIKRSVQGEEIMAGFNRELAAYKLTENYRRAVAPITSPNQEAAELVGAGPVELFTVQDQQVVLSAPGAKVHVRRWPTSYATPGPAPRTERAEVKVIDGPLAGRILEVDPAALRLIKEPG